jgi:hypothetical protein
MTPYEKVLTVRMQDTDHDVIRYYAYLTKASMNEIVTTALSEYFTKHAGQIPEDAKENMRRQHADDPDRIGPIASAAISPKGSPSRS